MIKLDGAGEIAWQKIYNKPNPEPAIASDWAYAMTQPTSGGFLILGETDRQQDMRWSRVPRLARRA